MSKIVTLHIRDAVSKTFHVADHEIILHVDINDVPIKIDEQWRNVLLEMIKIARTHADDVIEDDEVVLIDVHGEESPMLGDNAQLLWEKSIVN